MAAARDALDDPAGAASRLLARLALVVLMVLTPIGDLFFYGPLYVFLPVGAAILIVAGFVARDTVEWPRPQRLLRSSLAAAALFLLFWAGLSLLWTPFPDEAATRYFKTLGTAVVVFLAIVALPPKTRAENLYFLPAALAVVAVATIILTLFAPKIFWHGDVLDATLAQRSVMSLTILVWPALGALAFREKWLLAVALSGCVVVAVLATFVQIALVALVLGCVVYAVAVSEPQRVGQILGFGLAALILLAPVAALIAFALTSVAHAPQIGPGFIFADLILQHWPRFITGHGLDFTAQAMEMGVLPAAAPHSILFKIWYELGILGAIAFAVLSANVFIRAGQAPARIAAPLLAALVAGLVVAVWGVETTQIWWISLTGLAAIAFAMISKGSPPAHRPMVPAVDQPRRASAKAVRS